MKRAISEETAANPSATKFHRSSEIHDRSSTFVALFSPSEPARSLQAVPDFKDASHRIAAWRLPSRQRTVSATAPRLHDTGFDDDGEKYAGKRALKVLEDMKVEGSVVVARWYGGVLLGPVRFTHIENCAKEAISRYRNGAVPGEEGAEKRRKVDDAVIEEEEKRRLVDELSQRDENIIALRRLLDDKKSEAAGKQAEHNGDKQVTSPSKVPNYASLTLKALRSLDKARDATISWLLRSIDEAEAETDTKSKTPERTAGQGEIAAVPADPG